MQVNGTFLNLGFNGFAVGKRLFRGQGGRAVCNPSLHNLIGKGETIGKASSLDVVTLLQRRRQF